jgi:hypothetical protein
MIFHRPEPQSNGESNFKRLLPPFFIINGLIAVCQLIGRTAGRPE